MARIPYIEKSDLAPQDQDVIVRRFNLWQALANSPQASRHFQGMVNYLWESCGLERKYVELAILQVGYLTKAEYEWVHHIRMGLQFGLTQQDILAISDETAGRTTHLPALDRLVLQAAREMTRDGAITAATFDALRPHFDNAQLLNLVMVISFYIGVAGLLKSLEILAEDAHRGLLLQYPLHPA